MSTPVIPIDPSTMKAVRLPPFAREVQAAVTARKDPNVYVYATPDAWGRARRRRECHGADSAMILPPGEAPDSFRWPVVPGGLLVVAIGQPRTLAFELARCIVTCGTPLASALYGDNELLIVRRAEWKAAA